MDSNAWELVEDVSKEKESAEKRSSTTPSSKSKRASAVYFLEVFCFVEIN